MVATKSDNIIASLDIGTSNTTALVGRVDRKNDLEILAIASKASKGLKKGVIVDIDSVIEVVKDVIAEAEQMYGEKIESVVINISGSHISSLNSHGVVAIDDGEISKSDVDKVIQAAKAIPISSDQKIIHVLPQQYIVDSQNGIKSPLGMSGVRLEADIHIITSSESVIQNIIKIVRSCGLKVNDIAMNSIASAESVLSIDEKNLGVAVIDIGGGTTDVTVYKDGHIVSTIVLPIAGDQITNDLAVALRTPSHIADNLKIKYGYTLDNIDESSTISVAGIGERAAQNISLDLINKVLEARIIELFGLAKEIFEKNRLLEKLGAGVVLTGGSAKLNGIDELAERSFKVPIRVGLPKFVYGSKNGFSTIYATSIGLLAYSQYKNKTMLDNKDYPPFVRITRVIKNWIKSYM